MHGHQVSKDVPSGTQLVGFTDEMVMSEGIVSLLVIVINSYHNIAHLVDFFIVHR